MCLCLKVLWRTWYGWKRLLSCSTEQFKESILHDLHNHGNRTLLWIRQILRFHYSKRSVWKKIRFFLTSSRYARQQSRTHRQILQTSKERSVYCSVQFQQRLEILHLRPSWQRIGYYPIIRRKPCFLLWRNRNLTIPWHIRIFLKKDCTQVCAREVFL